MTVVLCAKGYRGRYKKNIEINNLKRVKLSSNDFIYHAGTKEDNDKIYSSGGRVLNITSIGSNFKKIRKKIHLILKKINWKNGFFRKDIGIKIIT